MDSLPLALAWDGLWRGGGGVVGGGVVFVVVGFWGALSLKTTFEKRGKHQLRKIMKLNAKRYAETKLKALSELIEIHAKYCLGKD